jgi:hypothetical protein
MSTFTIRHTSQMALSSLRSGFQASWRDFTKHRAFQELRSRYGLIGSVKATELTVGGNGWHLHSHVGLFVEGAISGSDMRVIQGEFLELWKWATARHGLLPLNAHGVDVRRGHRNLADYLEKYGHAPAPGGDWTLADELARSAVKKSRSRHGDTPWSLLSRSMTDEGAARLWLSYVDDIKGAKHLVWSRGFRARVGLSEVEPSDEELAQEGDDTGELLRRFTHDEWRLLAGQDAIPELLAAGTDGDRGQVDAFLASITVV